MTWTASSQKEGCNSLPSHEKEVWYQTEKLVHRLGHKALETA